MTLRASGTHVYEDDAIRIIATDDLLTQLLEQKEHSSLAQLRNAALLPGRIGHAIGLADMHPGYGFPVGGVVAYDPDDGMITVGGVGFDINCGVRVLATPLTKEDIILRQDDIAHTLFKGIPAGLGESGKLHLTIKEMEDLLLGGAHYIVKRGYGYTDDLDHIEENGRIHLEDTSSVSLRARQRNLAQVGTLGSGNHYLEIQYVDIIHDEVAAHAYGLTHGQVVISIHCGSRGLGHQVGSDYLSILTDACHDLGIELPEPELVGAPYRSPQGQAYYRAVQLASNAAFANRQMIAHLARTILAESFLIDPRSIRTVYEVAHNTAKIERHRIGDADKDVLVHRKGSTRAFGPGRAEVPAAYRAIGQPVPVGGTMGTNSYILKGTQRAMDLTYGSGIHGAGRALSRAAAKRTYTHEHVVKELRDRGIIVLSKSHAGIAEEAPGAYKDVDEVVRAVHESGINTKVVTLRPLVCIKG